MKLCETTTLRRINRTKSFILKLLQWSEPMNWLKILFSNKISIIFLFFLKTQNFYRIPYSLNIRRHQSLFFFGSSDEKKKVLRKFLPQKKRGFQIFRLRAIFVVKILKTAKFSNFSKNPQIFEKRKSTPKFFRLRRALIF